MTEKRDNMELQALSSDELDAVAGGKNAFTEEMHSVACPSLHANAVRTGQEREIPFLLFWHRRERQYRCPDCGYEWWKEEN